MSLSILCMFGPHSSSSSWREEILEGGKAPTDSGYALASHPGHKPEPSSSGVSKESHKPAGSTREVESCDDVQTLYSEATTAHPAPSQAHVSGLCKDIKSTVRQKASLDPLLLLLRVLPNLIKALTARIGQENESQVNQVILYFLHKSHASVFVLELIRFNV